MSTVHFPRVVNFHGRNGWTKCGGLNVFRLEYVGGEGGELLVSPLNSRRDLSPACRIDIPLESAGEVGLAVIEAAFRDNIDRDRIRVASDLLEEHGFLNEAVLLRGVAATNTITTTTKETA